MLCKLFLTFDVEDFISRNSIFILDKILEALKNRDLKALFFITGHMAEKLRDFPQTVDLLSEHQIGYHSSSHSVHPTIFEFTDVDDYRKAYEVSLERETSHINPLTGKIEGRAGIYALREIFPKKQITAFRAPGNCWSPPHEEALKSLGIYYDFSANISKKPVNFKGITFYPYPLFGHLEGISADNRTLLLSLRHEVSVINIHPSLLVNQREWDAIYYKLNPSKLIEPPTKSSTQIRSLLKEFNLLLKEISYLQKIKLIEVTPQLKKAETELAPSKDKVEKYYQTSIRWALKQGYKPKYIRQHFLKFFEINT